ncbi:MAG: AMP-binding protein [Pseudomonadota bacterium]
MSEPATLLECLWRWEREQPEAIAFTQPVARDRVVDYSWKQVADQVRRMAAHLQSLNLPANSNIAILGKNSAHWIICDLAIMASGHVSVPLYPTANAETVRYVLEHSEARLIFIGKLDDLWPVVAPGLPDALPKIRLPLAPKLNAPDWDGIVAKTSPTANPSKRDPKELATILYTSGSTGRPKGVMISFNAMMETPKGLHQIDGAEVKFGDRVLSYLPLAHAAERAVLEAPALYNGLHVYFAWSLETFLDDLRRARPVFFFSVPRLWTKFYLGVCEKLPLEKQKKLFRIPLLGRLVKRKILKQLGLEHTRVAISGSAPLAANIIAWYRSLGLELLEGYAMSENFAYSHGNRRGKVKLGTVGFCSPGVQCRISDEGEILVKSPGDMMGYYKDPQTTAASFTPDGFFKTGDRGSLDADGYLTITGRVKELFKTAKGKYVAPVPIENKLGNHPSVEIACVTGVGTPAAFALIQLAPELRQRQAAGNDRSAIEQEMESLLVSVNATLEPHELLGFIAIVGEPWTMENGLLTPTMKIKRSEIEKRCGPQAERWFKAARKIVWESAV